MEQKPYCKPYCKLGEVLDEQARARHVRGPYNVAKHVSEATGFKVSGSSVSGYFYGRSHPPPEFNTAFVEAFSLEEDEVKRLAYAYTFGKEPSFRQRTLSETQGRGEHKERVGSSSTPEPLL
jgi:hypothetical protein